MSCDNYRVLIDDRLDDSISERDKKVLEDHLLSCPECRNYFREMSAALDIFTTVEGAETAPDVSPYLAARVAARAAERTETRGIFRAGLALAATALTIMFLLTAGYYFFPRNMDPAGGATESISLQSGGIGFEIRGESFELHSRSKTGETGVDLKL